MQLRQIKTGKMSGVNLTEAFFAEIGGWVAMWRPMEIFLYDWWPVRAEARLSDRLTAMPVRIAYTSDASSEAWRWDWPVASPKSPLPTTAETPRGRAGTLETVQSGSSDRERA